MNILNVSIDWGDAIVGLLVGLPSLIVSIWALIKSKKTDKETENQDKKLNEVIERIESIDFQVSQSLQYEVWHLEAVLKSIQEKIVIIDNSESLEISKEIEQLSRLKMKPEYRVMQSLMNDGKREVFKKNMLVLTVCSTKEPREKILQTVNDILTTIDDTSFRETVDKKSNVKIDVLLTELNKKESSSKGKKHKHAARKKAQKSSIHYAKGIPGVVIVNNSAPIIPDIFHAKTFSDIIIEMVEVDHIDDPDVLLFYGVVKDNAEQVKEALEAGANVNVTDTEIMNRYPKYFENLNIPDIYIAEEVDE